MTDKRLLTCAELVRGRSAVDVGTDHGYLAVHLVQSGKCDRVTACDINEKPLEAARTTVAFSGCADRIKTVLSDGLDNIDKDGVTDVIMAGMGGELIIRLIERCSWLRDMQYPVNLVLQPMTKSETLRKWLYENDFEIKQELGCKDGGFVYSVIQAEYVGKEPSYIFDDRYIYGGRVEANTKQGAEYLKHQVKRIQKAGEGMLMSEDKKKDGERLLAAAEILLTEVKQNDNS